MLGLESGLTLHVVIATTGLSAALGSSDTLLTGVKYVGAAYLLYLGVRQLRSPRPGGSSAEGWIEPAPRGRWRLFGEAFVVDALNPKTVLFFVAFLPQFVDPDAGSPAARLLLLGVGVVLVAVACDGSWVLVSSLLDRRGDVANRSASLWRVTGVVYLALAALVVGR